jgi:phospholipid/cholesterol/gamma-HCH transport system substrate-binding protein
MNRHERGLEFKVGAFVFVGLAMIGALVVQFGRLGEGFKTYYPITVRFNDASGLLKGSDVLLAGAKIGKVSDGPHMVREGNGVDVPLKIYDYIKLPEGSKITVGSSGLLGDRFVNVTMPPGQPKKFIAPKSYIVGSRAAGIDDLTREGGELVTDLRTAVQNINGTVTKLNEEALSSGTMQNWRASIEHLNATTQSLSESSKKLEGVVNKANSAMSSIRKDADDMQGVIADARKTVQSATQVFREATPGNGLLAALLTNQDLANDLRALISNLRAHGVLFYRDSAVKTDVKPREQSTQRRPPRDRQ